MSIEKLEDLRQIIADENTNISTRKVAAEHLVAAMVNAVEEPADDDAEVVKLRTPLRTDDPVMGNLYRTAWIVWNASFGWSETGPTLAQARKHVHEWHRQRVVLTLVVDESAHQLERLAATQHVLDHLDARNFYRINGYSAQQLLNRVLAPNALRWTGKGELPVFRPPMSFADVWTV